MVSHLNSYFSKNGYLTRQEITAGYGRADLVLVKLNPDKCKIRKGHKQVKPLLKEHFFQILRQIPDINNEEDPININELYDSILVSKSYLKYHLLKELESAGYIKQVEKEYYYKINGWVPLVQEMIAIEAKLRDWKRGLIQANRYKSFADKSYLAILDRYEHLVDIDLLKNQNIGLYVVSENGEDVKEVLTPVITERVKQDKRNYVSEHYLKEALSLAC